MSRSAQTGVIMRKTVAMMMVAAIGLAGTAPAATTLLTFDGPNDPNPQPACSFANTDGPTVEICRAETFKLGTDYGSSNELSVRYARTVNVAGGTAVSPNLLFLIADGNGVGSSFGDVDRTGRIFFTPTAGYEVSFDSFDYVDRNSGAQNASFSLTDAGGNVVFSFTNLVAGQRTTYAANTAFFSGPLTFTFDGSGNSSPSVDNVRLTTRLIGVAAVPEPATWAMMLAGFGMTGAALRRRRAGSIDPVTQ